MADVRNARNMAATLSAAARRVNANARPASRRGAVSGRWCRKHLYTLAAIRYFLRQLLR